MSDGTKIEWSDATWNPTTGCDRVSPGCDRCYAMTLAPRLKAMGSPKYQTDGDPRTSGPGFGIAMHPDTLDQPLRWTRPRMIFVNSMSDLFHRGVTDEFIARVFAVMALAPQHTFQVLTKRHGRMRSLLNRSDWRAMCEAALARLNMEAHEAGAIPRYKFEATRDAWWSPFARPLPNVWLGVSVEDQARADLRIPALLDTPAAVRWLSCEPLLGPVDLGIGDPHRGHDWDDLGGGFGRICLTCGPGEDDNVPYFRRDTGGNGIDWVVVGGESGQGARPMDPAWARSLRDECQQAGVPFLFKQAGVALARTWGCSSAKGTDPAEWPELFPRQYPAALATTPRASS